MIVPIMTVDGDQISARPISTTRVSIIATSARSNVTETKNYIKMGHYWHNIRDCSRADDIDSHILDYAVSVFCSRQEKYAQIQHYVDDIIDQLYNPYGQQQ
jgi:hypothetical protein